MAVNAFLISLPRAALRVALVPLALAACGSSLVTPATDTGQDAAASLPSADGGLYATPYGTVLDSNVFEDDAAASTDASHAFNDATSDSSTDANAGPLIQMLSETVSSITQGGSFTIVAVVTDPQGPADLAGGQLTSGSGALLGAFVPTSPGSYSITVSWAQLNAAAPINFTGQTTLTNRATFYDAQGRQTSQSIPMSLYCGSAAAPNAACAGQCADLTAVDSCGSCAASCADAGGAGALNASCNAPGQCAWGTLIGPGTPSDTCASECSSNGGTCVGAQMTPAYSTTAIPETCSASPSSIGGSIAVSAVVTQISCICSANFSTFKTQTGDCASICGSSCFQTALLIGPIGGDAGDGVPTQVNDTCSAPYAVGIGTTWDQLVMADLPANETVLSPPSAISCQCEGPTQSVTGSP